MGVLVGAVLCGRISRGWGCIGVGVLILYINSMMCNTGVRLQLESVWSTLCIL